MRDPLLISAVRTFINTFLGVLGVLIALIVVGAGVGAMSSPYQTEDDLIEMRLLPDANGSTDSLSFATPVILQLNISGVIGMDHLTAGDIDMFLRASRKGVLGKDRVKGILLYIDSPGGTASDSGLIHHALLEYKQKYNIPIYAYTPSLCASGGYMLACAADKIYASPDSIVGSVGVKLGLGFNFWNFMQSHGIDSVSISAGKDKEKYPTFTKPQDGSYNDLITIVQDSYTQFVDLVATARSSQGLSADLLRQTYGAQVYIGSTAQKQGYVDNGTAYYREALSDLTKSLNLESYQVIEINYKHSPFKDLVSSKLSLWLNEAKCALFGLKHEGRLTNQLLHYYDPQSR